MTTHFPSGEFCVKCEDCEGLGVVNWKGGLMERLPYYLIICCSGSWKQRWWDAQMFRAKWGRLGLMVHISVKLFCGHIVGLMLTAVWWDIQDVHYHASRTATHRSTLCQCPNRTKYDFNQISPGWLPFLPILTTALHACSGAEQRAAVIVFVLLCGYLCECFSEISYFV